MLKHTFDGWIISVEFRGKTYGIEVITPRAAMFDEESVTQGLGVIFFIRKPKVK